MTVRVQRNFRTYAFWLKNAATALQASGFGSFSLNVIEVVERGGCIAVGPKGGFGRLFYMFLAPTYSQPKIYGEYWYGYS